MSKNEASRLLRWRMQSQLLWNPEGSISGAIHQMLAVQSQDLAAGRYAVAQRASEHVTRDDINDQFNAGILVRAWTMRGTLHICAAEDLHWLISATRDRTSAALATQRRKLELTTAEIARAETFIVEFLEQHGSAGRAELLAYLGGNGVNVDGQRGYHLLMAAVLNGLICLGPIPAGSGISAQDFVLAATWISQPRAISHPLQELVLRYLNGHAPATARDAAWYTGQTLTSIKAAVAELEGQLVPVAVNDRSEQLYATSSQVELWAGQVPSGKPASLRLLGPFDEYYLSYADRSLIADEALRAQIGPGSNGMVKAFWLREGRADSLWNANAAPTDRIGATLHQRYLRFRT